MAKHVDRDGPEAGQLSAFDEAALRGIPAAGTHRHAADVAVALAAADLSDVDRAASTLLTACAWSLDRFEIENKPYGPAKLAEPMLAVLRDLHMTPDSRVDEAPDAFEALIRELNASADDPADSAA